LWRTKAHPGGVTCIMLNGARIITGGSDKVVREWDAASSKGIRSFATCPASVGGFSKDREGADGSEKKRGGKGTLMISAHVAPITGVCTSVLGDRMFSCSSDRTVRVWDIASGNSVQQIRGGGNMFTSVCQSHKHLLICGTTDRFALAFHQVTVLQKLELVGSKPAFEALICLSANDALNPFDRYF
jgi:WD40 repeat protein